MDPNLTRFTGADYGFQFHSISSEWDEAKCQQYCSITREKFATLTKAWSDDLHSEWQTRNYLAVKMILSATVMLTSFEFCRQKNVRIVEPYLLYYATLSCCRALHFTSPDFQLQNTDLYAMRHQKIINVTGEHLERNFSTGGAGATRFLEELRADREMFSYRFPARGPRPLDKGDNFEKVVDACSLLAENAQLNSECLESSFNKNATGKYAMKPEIIEKCFLYDSDVGVHLDKDDYYRTTYMGRKMSGPACLSVTATEGLVEDFFGSWFPGDEGSDQYDPDANWGIIFPFD